MFRITREAIGDMAATLQARGSQLILMYIPQKAELYWERLSDESKRAIFSGSKVFGASVEMRRRQRQPKRRSAICWRSRRPGWASPFLI